MAAVFYSLGDWYLAVVVQPISVSVIRLNLFAAHRDVFKAYSKVPTYTGSVTAASVQRTFCAEEVPVSQNRQRVQREVLSSHI
jgi:hypothetical protein